MRATEFLEKVDSFCYLKISSDSFTFFDFLTDSQWNKNVSGIFLKRFNLMSQIVKETKC